LLHSLAHLSVTGHSCSMMSFRVAAHRIWWFLISE
jgi:hypothetical protein